MKRVASGILPVIAVDRKGPKPLHRQIYDAYRAAIVEGSLRPGQRVPSPRALPAELGVSGFPVLNAYSHLLAEGYFESRVGAGTVVSASLPDQFSSSAPASVARLPAARSVPRPGPRPVAHRCSFLPHREISPWLLGLGAFGGGQVAFDQFPLQVWSRLIARHSWKLNPNTYNTRDECD